MSRICSRPIATLLASVILAGSVASAPVLAQEGDPELGATTWQTGPCKDCHGWAGDGVPDVPQFEGVSLRETTLTPEQMAETIRCGRPGTPMPAWRNNAWTTTIPCYGMTEPIEGLMRGERMFGDRAIAGLVAFIFRDFVGKGPVTREYCTEVLGANSARCAGYPMAAEVQH